MHEQAGSLLRRIVLFSIKSNIGCAETPSSPPTNPKADGKNWDGNAEWLEPMPSINSPVEVLNICVSTVLRMRADTEANLGGRREVKEGGDDGGR